MDYRYLKAFISTVRHASFSKAAEELKIAQSAVSRQIKLLEDDLGVELIIRSSKKVVLTAKGEELYLASINFDNSLLEMFQKEDKHPLRVGVLHGLLESWFSNLVADCYHKQLRNLIIKVDTPDNLKKGLQDGILDIIVITENIQSELISSKYIFDEELVLISKDEIDKQDIFNCTWIVYDDNDNIYRLSKKHTDRVIKINSMTAIKKLVGLGVGIAVVPQHLIDKNDRLKSYHLPELGISRVYLSTLNYRTLPNRIKELIELIDNNLKPQ